MLWVGISIWIWILNQIFGLELIKTSSGEILFLKLLFMMVVGFRIADMRRQACQKALSRHVTK